MSTRRNVFALLLGCILLLALSVPVAAQVGVEKSSSVEKKVFTDAKAFSEAAKALKREGHELSKEAKQQRRLAISNALDKASLTDKSSLETVAEELGIIILNPNVNLGQTSSGTNDLYTIYAPTKTYDPVGDEYGINGVVQWMNHVAPLNDWGGTLNTDVGNKDGTALIFSYWPDTAPDFTSWYLATYDERGTQNMNPNPSAEPVATDGRLALVFTGQDQYLYGNDYTWWKMSQWAWYPAPGSPTGKVRISYAHNYSEVALAGFDFTLGPSAGTGKTGATWSVGMGFTWTFTAVDRSWAAFGLNLTY